MSVYFIGYWSWHDNYLQFLAIDIEHKLRQNYVLQEVCVIYKHTMSMDFRIKPKIKHIKVFREWIMLILKVTF